MCAESEGILHTHSHMHVGSHQIVFLDRITEVVKPATYLLTVIVSLALNSTQETFLLQSTDLPPWYQIPQRCTRPPQRSSNSQTS
jgi:hypothetical protein